MPAGKMIKFVSRKKPVYRRRSRITRVPRPVRSRYSSSRIVNVKRTTFTGTWLMDTAATSGFWRYLAYDMGSFNAFNEFQAIFDEYKVRGIKVTFRPSYDTIQNQQTANTALGQLQAYAHYTVDPAATVAPAGVYASASLNTFLEQGGVKTRTLNRPFSVFFRPQVMYQVAATGTGAALQRAPWIKTTEAAASFRGIQMYLQQNSLNTGNNNVRLDMFVTFYVSFRSLR